jgi:hypothetical protein
MRIAKYKKLIEDKIKEEEKEKWTKLGTNKKNRYKNMINNVSIMKIYF